MNQGIAFTRTLRALDADDFRASKLGLFAATALLIAWTWWMFSARVPQYESTTNVRIESGQVIAHFPPRALARIRTNQPATVHLGDSSFPARVQSVAADRAELVLAPNPQPPIPASSSGTAEIEVSAASPASITLRILGAGPR
jgi:hypothetical protein